MVWAHNSFYPTDQAGRRQLADELAAKGVKPTQGKQYFDRDKINKMWLEFKLAAINFLRIHPTGDSRFKMLESAPRQRASGLPRTTPRSPFLKTKAPGVFWHAGVFATNRPVDRILNNQGRGGCLGSVLWPVFYLP